MKKQILLFTLVSLFLITSCGEAPLESSSEITSEEESSISMESSSEIVSSSSSKPSSSSSSSSSESGPKKVVVPAHTLSDSNPPLDYSKDGDRVTKTQWNAIKNGSASKFNGNYNYTYQAYSGGYLTVESFTKNGYYMMTNYARQYYERKSGNTFYSYISTNKGYQRATTTLNLQDKYTSRIVNEIYVHMFDYENYEYDDYDGTYRYFGDGFTSNVRIINGYLVYLFYVVGMNVFEIKNTFNTTIEIPESYYYE